MTVLRSREIAPVPSREIAPVPSPLKALRKRVIEPSTPAKSHESSTVKSSSPDTVSSLPTNGNSSNIDRGSDLGSVSGVGRRRSLRLASKSNPDEVCVEAVSVSVSDGRRKRKSVGAGSSNEVEVENVEKIDDRVCDLRDERVRVLEIKEGVEEQKMDEPVFTSGLSSSRQKNADTMTANKEKGKRRLDIDINLPFVFEEDGDERVVKRRMDGVVEFDGDESVSGKEVVGDDRKYETLLSDGCGAGFNLNELEGNPNGSFNVCVNATKRSSSEEKGKGKVVEDGVDSVEMDMQPSKGENTFDKAGIDEIAIMKSSRKFSRAEKGKEKMGESALLSKANDTMELDLESEIKSSVKSAVLNSPQLPETPESVVLQNQSQVPETNSSVSGPGRRDHRDRFRVAARRSAARFAYFSYEQEDDIHPSVQAAEEMPSREADQEVEDWPGPFSTAMKIIRDRAVKSNVQQEVPSSVKIKQAHILWVPKKSHDCKHSSSLPPSLQELCMDILAKNADAITSLDNVPDVLRHKLCQLLCDSRRMNYHIFALLFRGSPTEVRIRDCSWLSEDEFTKSFEGCDTNDLMVLQLDQCGRCMPDYILLTTLASSPKCLPALTTISLKGACRLSDIGLSSLVSSAPALRSVNLSQCSLLTSTGIDTLADALGSILRELYIDDCQDIDIMLALPALKKLEHLEVLSLVGVPTVCDDFIKELMFVRGHNMKELVLTNCVKLTDSSMKVIAETCLGLRALDLVNLRKLTDSSIGYLANGCIAIQTLKLGRNVFSDEAIAAYLETCGEYLTELSLNNVTKAANNTALSLARRSRNLLSLDLSWCRDMTDEALGLIVDSCSSLRLLKLFGCTQVSNVFLDGHSNPLVKIIGMKMTPILKHLKTPHPEEGPLHYSSVYSST